MTRRRLPGLSRWCLPPAAEMSYNCRRGFPVVVPLLAYDDLGAALEWLARVFGFAEQ